MIKLCRHNLKKVFFLQLLNDNYSQHVATNLKSKPRHYHSLPKTWLWHILNAYESWIYFTFQWNVDILQRHGFSLSAQTVNQKMPKGKSRVAINSNKILYNRIKVKNNKIHIFLNAHLHLNTSARCNMKQGIKIRPKHPNL